MSRPLTEKQRRFVEAYMGKAEGNATESARIAGYGGDDPTDAYLASMGSENLRKPKIQKAIAKRVAQDPKIASRTDRQRFWTQVMYDDDERMSDRLNASKLLGKTQADFIERVEVTGKDGDAIKVNTQISDDELEDRLSQLSQVVNDDDKDNE